MLKIISFAEATEDKGTLWDIEPYGLKQGDIILFAPLLLGGFALFDSVPSLILHPVF